MTDIEKLQAKHREEAARKRAKLKERKARTRRLIQRGAILENALNEYTTAERISNDDIQKIIYFAIQSPVVAQYITEIGC